MAAQADLIRIVPIQGVAEVAAPVDGPALAPAAAFTYRGGPLMTAVEVFAVFWGAAWRASPQNDLADRLNAFFDFAVTSEVLDQLAEYGLEGMPIGRGRHTGSATIETDPPSNAVSDAAIQTALRGWIESEPSFPEPSANTLYFVYLPRGVSVVLGGSRSCQAFCGYHNDIGGQIFYAVVPYPGCAGCASGMSAFDALTTVSSHELCEAVTDPVPGEGWYDDVNGEIGDICAWQTKTLGGYTVQLEWSNRASACV